MRSRRRTVAPRAAVALLGLVLVAGCSASDGSQPFSGRVLDHPYTVPEQPLTDTDGDSYSLADDTDARLTLVFFGYTNCPDVCPLVMSTLAAAMNRLSDADRDDVDVVFVTTDPSRDTGPVLRKYLDGIDPSFLGLTGDLGTIIDIGKPMAVYVSNGQKLPTGGYDLGGHTSTILGLEGDAGDKQADILWDQDTSAQQFATDIHTVLTDGVPDPSDQPG